jgi:hypothetical protein
MSKNIKLASLSVAVVAALLGAYWGGYQTASIAEPTTDIAHVASEAPILAQTTQPQASGEESPHQEPTIDPEDVDPASIDWKAVTNRIFPGIDQMLLRANVKVDYSEAEIAAFNKLHVVEFNPTIQSVCNEEISKYTTTGFIEICHGVRAYPDHPYESMSVDQLMDLAEADAAAAVFISKKAETVEERIGFALRAAALSGKPGPVLATAVKEFTSSGITYTDDNKITSGNGTVPKTVITRLILETVAQKMGDPRANPDAWKKYIDDFAKTEEDRNAVLEAVQKGARSAMEHMAETQREITGSTQMRELLDA